MTNLMTSSVMFVRLNFDLVCDPMNTKRTKRSENRSSPRKPAQPSSNNAPVFSPAQV